MKTGGHFERCNVGSVEAHNERTPDYLASVKAAGRSFYFFHELTPNNTHWVNPEFDGITCNSLFEQLQQLYKEKTGQMPQLKDRERVNKKTGKVTTIAGWSPIREACIPIKPETTTNDFDKVFDWLRQKGLEPIRLDLHKDEGYKDKDTGEVKMNYHAHLVVCWVNRETGKTAKLNAQDMSEFNQVVLPNALGMEAGEAKAVTGKEHLTPDEQRKKAEIERLEKVRIDKRKAADEEIKRIDEEVSEKKRKATTENIKGIGAGVAKFFGTGEIADLKKENNQLKGQIKALRDDFEKQIKEEQGKVQSAQQNAKDSAKNAVSWKELAEKRQTGISSFEDLLNLCFKFGIETLKTFRELYFHGKSLYTGWLKNGQWKAYANNATLTTKENDLLVDGYKATFWISQNERKQAQEKTQDIDDKPRRGQHL